MAGPLSDALMAALESEELWTWALSAYQGHLAAGTAPRFRQQLADRWASRTGGTRLKGNQIDAYILRLNKALNVPVQLVATGQYPTLPDLRVQPFLTTPHTYRVRATVRFDAGDGRTYTFRPHTTTFRSRPTLSQIMGVLRAWAEREARRLKGAQDTHGGHDWTVSEINIVTIESGDWR